MAQPFEVTEEEIRVVCCSQVEQASEEAIFSASKNISIIIKDWK
jgi:hypothetical protein